MRFAARHLLPHAQESPMARKPNGPAPATISKSQAVRDYLAEHPTAMPKEIAPAVKSAHGLDVSPQMISMIKSKLGKKGRPRRHKAGVDGAAPASGAGRKKNSARFTIEDLITAKKLAQTMGGIPRAQEALAALARLNATA
jgi:hypothetical protein